MIVKEIKFEDCKALIYDDGTILFSDYSTEHVVYLEREEVEQLCETLKTLILKKRGVGEVWSH